MMTGTAFTHVNMSQDPIMLARAGVVIFQRDFPLVINEDNDFKKSSGFKLQARKKECETSLFS